VYFVIYWGSVVIKRKPAQPNNSQFVKVTRGVEELTALPFEFVA
jgi:hypothetical protein